MGLRYFYANLEIYPEAVFTQGGETPTFEDLELAGCVSPEDRFATSVSRGVSGDAWVAG